MQSVVEALKTQAQVAPAELARIQAELFVYYFSVITAAEGGPSEITGPSVEVLLKAPLPTLDGAISKYRVILATLDEPDTTIVEHG